MFGLEELIVLRKFDFCYIKDRNMPTKKPINKKQGNDTLSRCTDVGNLYTYNLRSWDASYLIYKLQCYSSEPLPTCLTESVTLSMWGDVLTIF